MCVAVMRLPPTALAMSARSVVLVTTLSCGPAGAAVSAANASHARVTFNLLNIIDFLPAAAPESSEWMRFVRAKRERRLEKNAIYTFYTRGRHVTFVHRGDF